MSDRIKGLTVTLEDNVRDDDAQKIIDAIKLMRRVIDVKPHIANPDHYFAVSAAKHQMLDKMKNVLFEQS